MKKIIPLVVFLIFTGCTKSTQPIVAQALQEGINQAHSVFYDMSKIARQEILNSGASAVVKAVESQDAQSAQLVVKDVFDKMNDVDYLHIQWERSRSLIRMGQEFIWEERGILDIMTEEWGEASNRAASEDLK